MRDENSMLKRRDLKPVEVRDAIPATSTQKEQTQTALMTAVRAEIVREENA